MTELGPFPDTEAAVIELLADLGTCDVETPPDLAGNLPFHRVARLPGSDDRIFDSSVIVIDTFDTKRSDAKTLAEAVRQRLLDFPHVLSDCVLDKVTTDQSPNAIPWGDQNIRRFTASYLISTRRHA